MFILTNDPSDVSLGRVQDMIPGVRGLCDFDAAVARQFGACTHSPSGQLMVTACLMLLDPALRVMQVFPCGGTDPAASPLAAVEKLPWPVHGPAQSQAPVIVVPRVFELAHGGEESGYMRNDADGIHGVIDHDMKRRRDCLIEDEPLRRAIAARIRRRRLLPEVLRVFRFDATRMERYLVACYDGATGGFFRPHRDNDGTGHRQFAVTLNLNTEDYEGGDLCFPEYGRQTYRAPTGGACVFSSADSPSCSTSFCRIAVAIPWRMPCAGECAIH